MHDRVFRRAHALHVSFQKSRQHRGLGGCPTEQAERFGLVASLHESELTVLAEAFEAHQQVAPVFEMGRFLLGEGRVGRLLRALSVTDNCGIEGFERWLPSRLAGPCHAAAECLIARLSLQKCLPA